MPKRTAAQQAKKSNERLGVPGSDKLTNSVLLAAQKPAQEALAAYEHTQRCRIEAAAAVARERWPNSTQRIDRWCAAQIDVLQHLTDGLRDSLRAFSERIAEGERFRSAFLNMTPAQVDEYLLKHPVDAAWLAGFTKDGAVKNAFYRNLTQPAREAARRARLMQGGQDWRNVARSYSAGNDPDTGRPWRTKRRMYEWIGAKLKKDPETVRKELSPSKRK